jgi:hypothetical protein
MLMAAITAGWNMNESNCHTGSVFLSSDIPFSLHGAVLLQWFLLVGLPAWFVFLSVFWVVGWNDWCRVEGLVGGKALLLTSVFFF